MRCFIAKSGRDIFTSNWVNCLHWGIEQVKNDQSGIVKIHHARGGENLARVVAEIDSDGISLIRNGRIVPLKRLQVVDHGKG